MSEQTETKSPEQKLERFAERKFQTYEAASMAKTVLTVQPMTPQTEELVKKTAKAKIFARYDGTFDLVFYQKIQSTAAPKAPEPPSEAQEKPIHGLKSKERKRSPKRAQQK